jgi:flagellar protein FlaJ
MFFDLKKFFNKIGNLTVNSSRKVGEGIQTPIDKISELSSENVISRRKSDLEQKVEINKGSNSKSLFRPSNSPSRTIKRMRMDKEEIALFKELVDKKSVSSEKIDDEKEKKEALRKASLEEILKDEQKEELDPKLIIIMGLIAFAVVVLALVVLGFGIMIGLIFGVIILMMAIFIVFLPQMRKGKKSSDAAKELPFALRQMATELRAGTGLHDSMRSISLSGYGPLSEEFSRTLEEIRYGETTEKALIDMSERINSEGLQRAVYQITRTLNSGGDLAKTLSVIADDTAYELRMKLKDYAQKLNSFTMIYMFIAILFPVITMIMLIAASTVMGAFIPPILLLIIYLFFFPAIVIFMAYMIKRLEPQI